VVNAKGGALIIGHGGFSSGGTGFTYCK